MLEGQGGASSVDVRATTELSLVRADVWGPVGAVFRDDSRVVMTLIDELSQTVWAYLLQDDGEAFSCFVAWKTRIE